MAGDNDGKVQRRLCEGINWDRSVVLRMKLSTREKCLHSFPPADNFSDRQTGSSRVEALKFPKL